MIRPTMPPKIKIEPRALVMIASGDLSKSPSQDPRIMRYGQVRTIYDEGYGEPNEESAGLRFLSPIQLCLLPLLDLR